MAQSNVYSLNIVGYVNLTVKPGFNLISLPLQNADATSSINSVFDEHHPLMPGVMHSPYQLELRQFILQPGCLCRASGDGNWYDLNGHLFGHLTRSFLDIRIFPEHA